MPRKMTIAVDAVAGGIAECVIWVNHNLVADSAPKTSWEGKVPSSATPVTVEVVGVGTSTYHVAIAIDDESIVDTDRDLHGGEDVFRKLV